MGEISGKPCLSLTASPRPSLVRVIVRAVFAVAGGQDGDDVCETLVPTGISASNASHALTAREYL